MQKYIFAHLPKTAGTSFRSLLGALFGNDAVSPGFAASRIDQAEAEKLDNYTVICGHISLVDIQAYFPERAILTILREPVDRCVSWYFYAKNNVEPAAGGHSDVIAAQNCTVDEFFEASEEVLYRNIINRQVRQLGAHALNMQVDYEEAYENAKRTLESAAWVGTQETLGADIARLISTLGLEGKFDLENLNVTKERKATYELSARTEASIRRLNKYDLQLYQYARNELLNRRPFLKG